MLKRILQGWDFMCQWLHFCPICKPLPLNAAKKLKWKNKSSGLKTDPTPGTVIQNFASEKLL